jgi:predicted outer membrane repeat protein
LIHENSSESVLFEIARRKGARFGWNENFVKSCFLTKFQNFNPESKCKNQDAPECTPQQDFFKQITNSQDTRKRLSLGFTGILDADCVESGNWSHTLSVWTITNKITHNLQMTVQSLCCVIALLCLSSLHVVSGQSVIPLYVSPSSTNNTAPCGTTVDSPCRTLKAAYETIPLLSTSTLDNVTVYLFPGIHISCDVSYFSLVTNVSASTALGISIQSLNEYIATLTCLTTSYGRIVSFDSDGLKASMSNVNLSITNGRNGVHFDASSGNNTNVSFSCFGCSFVGNSNGVGVRFYDSYLMAKIGLTLNLYNSSFTSLSFGLFLRGTTYNAQRTAALAAGLPCYILIENCSIYGFYIAVYLGGRTYATVNNSVFTKSSFYSLYAAPFSTYSVWTSRFYSGGLIGGDSSGMSFGDCLFDGIGGFVISHGQTYTFKSSKFLNIYTSSGLFTFSAIYATLANFSNCSFCNISSSNSASSVILASHPAKWMNFTDCVFVHSKSNVPLFSFPSGEINPASVYFQSCSFTSSVVMFGPLFQFFQTTYSSGVAQFRNCDFSNVTLSSPSGMFTTLSVITFNFMNSKFINISNPSLGLFVLSSVNQFVLQGCSFQDFSGTSLLLSFASKSILISDTSFLNITTPLQGLFRLIAVSNASMANSAFSSIYGSIVVEQGSLMNINNCSFSQFFSSPVFNLLANTALNASKILVNGSTGVRGGCVSAGTNVSLFLSNSIFENCIASRNGGAVFMSNASTLQCSRSNFSMNSALESGGAIFASQGCNVSIADCWFSSNTAGKDGGAIYAEWCTAVTSTTFLDNFATKGGGIFSNQLVNLSFCLFEGNHAENGGGVYLHQLPNSSQNNTFKQNSAQSWSDPMCLEFQGSGGAVFVDLLNLTDWNSFISWKVTSNTASYFGGGFASKEVSGSQFVPLLSSSVTNNSALYGADFGTIWKVLELNNLFSDSVAHLNSPISVSFRFVDGFDQSSLGVQCEVFVKIISSIPDLGLSLDQNVSVVKKERYNDLSLLNFSFISNPQIHELTSPNESSILFLQVKDELDGIQLVKFSVQVCPDGYQIKDPLNSLITCVPCPAGTFLFFTEADVAFCQECERGKYSKGRSTFCSNCSPGSISQVFGSEICASCGLGSYSSTNGSTECQTCKSGTFTLSIGSQACEICSTGAITVNEGGSSAYSCVCPPGMYGKPWDKEACKTCSKSKGSQCGLNSSIPFVNPGYWRSPIDQSDVFQCIPLASCNYTGLAIETTCSIGYTGNRCGGCIEGQFYHFDVYCKNCADKTISSGAAGVIAGLLILLALNLISSYSQSSKRLDFTSMISTLQFLALYPRIGSNWPPNIKALFESMSVSVSSLFHYVLKVTLYSRISILTSYLPIAFSKVVFG